MILSFFVLPSFVFAQDDGSMMPLLSVNGVDTAFQPIKNLFADWGAGELDVNVAKFLFWMLVFIVVFSVSEFIPFLADPGKDGLRILFAAIVSFLGTAYFTPTDVYVLLASYTAMGMALAAIIPLVVLLAVTYRMGTTRRNFGGGIFFINTFMWLIYAGFLLTKGIQAMNKAGSVTGGWSWFVFLVCFVVALIMLIFQRQIMNWFARIRLAGTRTRLERRREAEQIMGEHDEARLERAERGRRRERT